MSSEPRNEDQVTAILSLINMGIRSIPEGVLKTSFADVSKSMLDILKEFSNSENNIIIRSVMGILAALLKTQELASWSLSSTSHVFDAILNPYSIHPKPKVKVIY